MKRRSFFARLAGFFGWLGFDEKSGKANICQRDSYRISSISIPYHSLGIPDVTIYTGSGKIAEQTTGSIEKLSLLADDSNYRKLDRVAIKRRENGDNLIDATDVAVAGRFHFGMIFEGGDNLKEGDMFRIKVIMPDCVYEGFAVAGQRIKTGIAWRASVWDGCVLKKTSDVGSLPPMLDDEKWTEVQTGDEWVDVVRHPRMLPSCRHSFHDDAEPQIVEIDCELGLRRAYVEWVGSEWRLENGGVPSRVRRWRHIST